MKHAKSSLVLHHLTENKSCVCVCEACVSVDGSCICDECSHINENVPEVPYNSQEYADYQLAKNTRPLVRGDS